MITTLEIIERSIYDALLERAIKLNLTVNPEDYQPPNQANLARFQADTSVLNPYVQIYGVGNNISKGIKDSPRVTIQSRGFYPGAIGVPKLDLNKGETNFEYTEVAYETLDQFVDISLIANNQEHIRLLHTLLFQSIPQRGYIKPYFSDELLPTGNIFLEVVNFYDKPELATGLLEKVYQFAIYDCLLEVPTDFEDVTPIKEITFNLENIILNIK